MIRNRVLVVEDDRDASEVMSLVIELLGHECRGVHCGGDAMRIVREREPQIAMDEQSGTDVAPAGPKP